jgi:hypothetical protein
LPLPVLPTLFLDRSVGRIQLPALLRAEGIKLVTLAEHYGMRADETVEDTTWLRDTAALGWACVMKDETIRRAARREARGAAQRCPSVLLHER